MEIIYCQKCHNKKRGNSYENAKSQIAEALNIDFAQIEDGCSCFCGPGAKNHFVEIDGEVVFDLDFEQFIKKLEQY